MKEMKTCTRCNESHPATTEYFYSQKVTTKSKGTFYKLTSWCKKCMYDKSVEYYQKNKEDIKPKARQHYKDNTEYYLTKQKEADQRGKERKKAYSSKWQKENPDKVKEYKIEREMHKKHEISNNEWENCKNYFNYRCAYCGLKIEEHFVQFKGKTILGDFHREHVDHEGANDLSNCVPSCRSCNSSKREKELIDWYSTHDKYSVDRLNKIHNWLDEDYKLYIKEITI